MRKAFVLLASAALGMAALSNAAAQAAPASGAESASRFTEWANLASAQTRSPAVAEPGDHAKEWTAPDGRVIRLVVKVPRPREGAPVVTLPTVPPGDDARPYFEAALARVRELRAGTLVVPKATYTFKSTSRPDVGHLLLKNLSDLTIDGNGATLLFTQNQPGILVNASQRLKLTRLTLEYSLHTASVGSIESRDGHNVLRIHARYPVSNGDAVHYASEFDPAARAWIHGGQRVILPPGSSTPAISAGDQTYTSAAFKNVTAGKTFVVFHHWYGGAAIRIDDTRSPTQSEDVVIDDVTIHSAPGMGILTYGLKRGLAILNSTVSPKPDSSSPISTEYDAIHVLLGGGDILLSNNRISGQGDDGINLNNPIHPIVSIGGNGTTLVMSTYSRFISAGDALAFFDGAGRYLGQARVSAPPKPLGGLNNQIVLDAPVPGLDASSVARDIALVSSRFHVEGNTIERCNCHGLLVQLPNGLVERNTFRQLNYNAIRLLTNVGGFKEGVGAFNVVVRRNTISGTGVDSSLPMPWAAISVYGAARGGVVANEPVNKDIEISDNTITDSQQACITVASSRSVKVVNNSCNATNLRKPGEASVNVFNTSGVVLDKNKRSGPSTGGLQSQAGSNAALKSQPGY